MMDSDIQKIIRPEKFDKFMAQFGLMSNVVFAATNYVIARHAGAAQAEKLFCELADAVAELPVSETVGRGKGKLEQ